MLYFWISVSCIAVLQKNSVLSYKVMLHNFEATASLFYPHNHFKTCCESMTLKDISIIKIRKIFLRLAQANLQFLKISID